MAKDPLIGTTLEKCRILSRLGKGGMGAVYLAEHETIGKKVAVKILPDSLAGNPEAIARFRREAITAGKLDHPNIVQVHDIGHDKGKYFIVMQYVEGESLQFVAETLGTVAPADACRLTIEILNGLHHAHKAGIIHRDVKPENVLLGPGDQPMILDFGLAVETEDSLRLTADGTVIGTPYFISPEQARGRRATTRSDIYSTGVTLYYLLTGKFPFSGETALAILNKHATDTPLSPIKLNPKVPEALNDIVLRMMAKKAEDRYPTALDAARDLQRFLDGKLEEKKPPPPPPPPSRKKWIVSGIAAGIVILFALAIIFSPDAPRPNPGPGNGSGPDPDNGRTPAGDTYKEARVRLAGIIEYKDTNIGDYASFLRIERKFNELIEDYPEFSDAAEARAAFLDHVRKVAEADARRCRDAARPLLEAGRLGLALAELREYSDLLLDVEPVGPGIKKEVEDLRFEIWRKFENDEKEVDRLLTAGELGSAEKRAEAMSMYIEPDLHQRMADVRERIETRKERLLEDARPRVRREIAAVEKRVSEALSRREFDRALDLLRRYVGQVRDAEVDGILALVPDVDYDALPKGLDDALFEAPNEPRYRFLLLFRDAHELRKLPGSASPHQLAEAGDAPPRRIGLAFLHSDLPGRALAARQWLRKAEEQGEDVPDFRLREVSREAEAEHQALAEEHLSSARALYEEKKYAGAEGLVEEARAALEKKKVLPFLERDVRTLEAQILMGCVEELVRDGKGSAALKIVERLRKDYVDVTDEGKMNDLHAATLLATGSWSTVPPTLSFQNRTWGWNRKNERAPCPATQEGGAIRMRRGRLVVNTKRSSNYAGFSTVTRLNAASATPDFGLLFDLVDSGFSYKALLVRSGQVELWSCVKGKSEMLSSMKIAGPKVGQWVELAFTLDKDEVVCTYGGKFVCRVKMILTRGENGLGLYSNSDVSFKSVRVRK